MTRLCSSVWAHSRTEGKWTALKNHRRSNLSTNHCARHASSKELRIRFPPRSRSLQTYVEWLMTLFFLERRNQRYLSALKPRSRPRRLILDSHILLSTRNCKPGPLPCLKKKNYKQKTRLSMKKVCKPAGRKKTNEMLIKIERVRSQIETLDAKIKSSASSTTLRQPIFLKQSKGLHRSQTSLPTLSLGRRRFHGWFEEGSIFELRKKTIETQHKLISFLSSNQK